MKISVALTVFSVAQIFAEDSWSQKDCARFINVKFNMPPPNPYVGNYILVENFVVNGQPIYRRDDGEYCMFAMKISGIPGDRLNIGECGVPGNDSSWVGLAADETFTDLCFEYNMAESTEKALRIADQDYHSAQYYTPATPCAECRNVLDGPLKAWYHLKSIFDSRCDE